MTDRFAFPRHWGAELLPGGAARFRLWAPKVERLSLVCGGGDDLPMKPAGDGWFEIETNRVPVGGGYAFRMPDGVAVPDPAARAQMDDVHGPSRLVDPNAYRWKTGCWAGRPWEEAVIYELHTGTFTHAGTFAGIKSRLDHFLNTRITAIELMPVAQFGGNRGWGYDGVLHYAPHRAYGGPEGLKALVDAAHERELMVLLDVVYNHFGPDGNYLHLYAPDFFDASRETPWGDAIAYARPAVRDFLIDNVFYWLEEYRFDGLRFDAINEIRDESDEPLMEEIGRLVRARIPDRHIHLTTEDDRNITRLHERDADGAPTLHTAEWNDDVHHAAHVIATGETEGYYVDYADRPVEKLALALAEGFAFQGEPSRFWDSARRGAPSAHQPPGAFIDFIQNHDQIGNRAFNERLTVLVPPARVEALTAALLLSPHIPLLFMGEEWGETNPFGFFTDFHGALADAVREGRRREFRRFTRFSDSTSRQRIPDPNAESTFAAARLNWDRLDTAEGRARHALFKRLLTLRAEEIVPRLAGIGGYAGTAAVGDGNALAVRWRLHGGGTLMLVANLGDVPAASPMAPAGRVLFETAPGVATGDTLPPWSVASLLEELE